MEQVKQQTAVQWLVDKLMKGEFINSTDELVDQALEIERQQIMHAQMDMFLHMNQTPYGLEYLVQFDEAYTFAQQYFTDTYHTEP